jgi:serine/threonine-protein kinase HipA
LLGVQDDLRQGALRFRVDEKPFLATQSDGVPLLTDRPTLLDLADRVEKDTAKLPDLERLLRAGGSIGGARPKAHVLDDDGSLAIAKFPSSDGETCNVMDWRKVAFDLARARGIQIPNSQLLRLAGQSIHVIDRFDRTPDGLRIGYVSAMTMLEASDGDERSYLEIAEAIENYSDQASSALKELWHRILFSVFVSNTDNHRRNHGFPHTHPRRLEAIANVLH